MPGNTVPDYARSDSDVFLMKRTTEAEIMQPLSLIGSMTAVPDQALLRSLSQKVKAILFKNAFGRNELGQRFRRQQLYFDMRERPLDQSGNRFRSQP